MHPTSNRWKEVTPSQFAWEREALAFVRERLGDYEPHRAWSNFEFIAEDGAIYEVDLLVVSPKGFFLVEIKSRSGDLKGDAGTWTWTHEGRAFTEDNPLLLANRKAKKLASLLRRQRSLGNLHCPFLEALVFLSSDKLGCQLDPGARHGICVRDETLATKTGVPDVMNALTNLTPAEYNDPRRARIDRKISAAIARALDEAGIRQSQLARKVGDYKLEQLLFEGPGYQDWQATHVSLGVVRRVRIYTVAQAATAESREMIARAAKREFQLLEEIEHPGILRAHDYREHELGPALVFDHDPDAIRLDHYLARNGERLSITTRLHIVRQIAEALAHAHRKRLVHRALSPDSVLVREPDLPTPRIQLFNWQTGARAPGSSSAGGTATTHLGELVETNATCYLAPESFTDASASGIALDVFSLGAIAYHVFSGKPPAATFVELSNRVREGKGLQIAAVLNGAGENLCLLIQYATHPEVLSRIESVDEFVKLLDEVEEELTTPDDDTVDNPVEAKAGERLPGGFQVKQRLGKGSTAVVFLVEKDGKQQVLKLALSAEHNARLHDEAEVLRKLRHHLFIELHEEIDIKGLKALLMAQAGKETLAHRLRSDGRLHIDLLQRFGDDLLEALYWLDKNGIAHRDIKPDNIGIAAVGRSDALHLVLFDFSLSRTPADRIRAGTVPYLDPFLVLRKPPRWDESAERFSAGMVLYEMATGTLPRWGDGRSDPAVLDCEVTLDTEMFDAAIREPLAAFFRRALARDPAKRFDNVEDMRSDWRKAFEAADRAPVPTEHEAGADQQPEDHSHLDRVNLDTALAVSGLSTRAVNALERENALTIRNLLRLPVSRISHMRGVGNKTRRELMEALRYLAARFSRAEIEAGPSTALPEPADGDAVVFSVDLLFDLLVPKRTPAGEAKILGHLLGADQPPSPLWWPSQTEVGEKAEVTRARVSQVLGKVRARWSSHGSLTLLRDEIAENLRREGGVVTVEELRASIVATRGSAHAEPLRTQLATAVTRAALEAEEGEETPRWVVRRNVDKVFVAIDDNDGDMLADFAIKLGKQADQLASEDPLPSPARVVETLSRIGAVEGLPPVQPARLVQLAAAASRNAAVSPRLELYPRGMAAIRALKLAHGALLGARELDDQQIRERVAARFPEAAALPGRPALDALLREAGSELEWRSTAGSGTGAYCPPTRSIAVFTTASTSYARHQTAMGPAPTAERTPGDTEAELLERRLVRVADEGGFLVLTVEPKLAALAEEGLRRFPVRPVSLEAALLTAMKAAAGAANARWDVILNADASPPDGRDWQRLQMLVRTALDQVEQQIADPDRTVLLTRPGLLARYGQIGFLERLRDRIGRRASGSGTSIHGLWVLVPQVGPDELPVLDKQPVPVLTPGQWTHVPEGWATNQFRAGLPGAPPLSAPH
jgi:serine/threonine protein kinase